jgi:hypothetical protein
MENKIKHPGELDFTLSLILTNNVHSTMNRAICFSWMDRHNNSKSNPLEDLFRQSPTTAE